MYVFVCMLFIGYNIMPRRVVEYCIYISCYNMIIIIGIFIINIIFIIQGKLLYIYFIKGITGNGIINYKYV